MTRLCIFVHVRTLVTFIGVANILIGLIGSLSLSPFLLMSSQLRNSTASAGDNPNLMNSTVSVSVVMEALQGFLVNEWNAWMIFYPPLLLTFILGIQLLIAVHQTNYCIAKFSLILNYLLVGLLLIMTLVLLANHVELGLSTPFLVFSFVESLFLWGIFEFTYTLSEREQGSSGMRSGRATGRGRFRNLGTNTNKDEHHSKIASKQFENEDEDDDLNL